MSTTKSLGQIAYEACVRSRMPGTHWQTWHDTSERDKQAWEHAADAVVMAHTPDLETSIRVLQQALRDAGWKTYLLSISDDPERYATILRDEATRHVAKPVTREEACAAWAGVKKIFDITPGSPTSNTGIVERFLKQEEKP